MTTPTILEVSASDIARLPDGDLRELVARLCRAELLGSGFSASAVTAGGGQDDPDGGVDVRVDLEVVAPRLDFVPRGRTGFQVKATPMTPAKVGPEMRPKGRLRKSIAALLSAGGAYVIVGSKDSTADGPLQTRRAAMRAAKGRLRSPGAVLDFYGADRVSDWVNQHPGVALWVRERLGVPLLGWRSHGNWACDVEGGAYALEEGPRVETISTKGLRRISLLEAIDEIRATLRAAGGAVRLVGLSGTGKTRLAQALFDFTIGLGALFPHRAIYCDLGQQPKPGAQEMLSRLLSMQVEATLVVDNCNPEAHRELVSALRGTSARVSLLSIEYDVTADEPEETAVYRLGSNGQELLEEIVRRHYPKVSHVDRLRILSLSEGNARVALALAGAASRTGTLGALQDHEIFSRLFWQRRSKDEALERVAQFISLVYSFDATRHHDDPSRLELPRLAQLARIDVVDLQRAIGRLKQRGVVQTRGKWCALLPHALANRLAKEAIELVDDTELSQTLWGHDRLLKSFGRRLSALHDSERAREIARHWLADDGWLARLERLNMVGVALFEHVAPLEPELTLRRISASTALPGAGLLSDISAYERRPFVAVARHLAYDPSLFEEATQAIARMALCEGESDQKSTQAASAVLPIFFRPLHSGTHATATLRLKVLDRLLTDVSPEGSALAAQCFDSMIKTRWIGGFSLEPFGAHSRDGGWAPKSLADVGLWYTTVLVHAKSAADRDGRVAGLLSGKLARVVGSLWFDVDDASARAAIRDFCVSRQGKIGGTLLWRGVAVALVQETRRKRNRPTAGLVSLEMELRPTALMDRIEALVVGHLHGELDPLSEERLAAEIGEQPTTPYRAMLETLGQELNQADRSNVLRPLVERGHLGHVHELGCAMFRNCRDADGAWAGLLSLFEGCEPKERSTDLLRGFVAAARLTDPRTAARLVATVDARGERLFDLLIDLYSVIGIGDSEATRLLAMAHRGEIPADRFSVLQYGRVLDSISPEVHTRLVSAVSHMPDGLSLAVGMMNTRLHRLHSDKAQIDEHARSISRELLLRVDFGAVDSPGGAYVLDEVLAAAALDGEGSGPFATKLSRLYFGAILKNHSIARNHQRLGSLLFRKHPLSTLQAFFDASSRKGGSMMGWVFMDRHHPVNEVPENVMLEWAGADPRRDQWIAQYVDAIEDSADGTPRLSSGAKTLLSRAPSKQLILERLERSVLPTSWTGSYATASSRAAAALDQLTRSDDKVIAKWAVDVLERIQSRVRSDSESRREREESFE